MTAQLAGSALIALAALPWAGWPVPAAWPWIAASVLLSMGAVACLLRAYEHLGFGVAYPVTRASSVLLVLPLAAARRRGMAEDRWAWPAWAWSAPR